MPLQLKDAIDKLYRPPRDGKRQVLAMSRGVAEKLPRLESVAVISVTAPARPLASLDGFKQVLRLRFADVDFMSPQLSARAKGRLGEALGPEHVAMIREFVEGLPDGVASVVVHCEGGYSRSCAIALGLHHLYGWETDTRRLEQANHSVLSLMLNAWRQRN